MAQVQQVPPMNGLPEKNGMGGHDESHLIPNGLFHSTPTKDLNGASTSLEDELQLSPSDLRRRSTRASALKAQEKIKLKDDIVQGTQKRLNEDEEGQVEGNSEETMTIQGSHAKKRRLEDGTEFDQTCFRFGLRANDEGEVYAMTDESENSSIHDSEMEVVRYHYEKMKNREPDAEQLKERLKMKREAENALRNEEAHLNVLKRMRDSQARSIAKLSADSKARDMAEAATAAANAYKPVQAKLAANGKNQHVVSAQKTLATLANLSIEQQLDLLGKLAHQSPVAKQAYALAKKQPSQTTTIFTQLIALNSLQAQKQKEAAAEAAMVASQNQLQQQQQAQISQHKLLNQQTPAQRIQAARVAFRTQADKQLMTIPTQKSQPHDITFLPNPNAAAFMAMHGLDIVVQFVQKDDSFYKKYEGPAYECEECKTDCAPTWKAIGSSPDDLHLYCEQCVRSAQKRKNRLDQTNLLKRAFQKISAQEKEFEKKIAEGQLEQFAEAKAAVMPQATPSSSSTTTQIPTSATATVSSTPLPRLHNLPSSSGTSTPSQAIKTSTPLAVTPKNVTAASAKKPMTPQQQMMAMLAAQMSQQMKGPLANQMMSMYVAQAAQAAQAVQQMSQAAQRNATNGMTAQQQQTQMAMLMAQAQVLAQAQQAQQAAQAHAQAQAAQQAQQAQAQAQAQQAKNAAREAQQHQQAMLLAAASMFQGGNAQQLQQQIQKMTPSQQKQLAEFFKNAAQKK